MCTLCEDQEQMKADGLLVCGDCGDPFAVKCDEGHLYCPCAPLMEPYSGGPATRCFRCAADL